MAERLPPLLETAPIRRDGQRERRPLSIHVLRFGSPVEE